MLKSLVQLFAEKYLQSKKSWVAEQSAPSGSYVAVTPQTTGGSYGKLAVAPFDGYCVLKQWGWSSSVGQTESFGCIENPTNLLGVGTNPNAGRFYVVLPVKKGDTIHGRILKGATYEFMFVKATGQT